MRQAYSTCYSPGIFILLGYYAALNGIYVTDTGGQPFGSIFKSQALLASLTLYDGTDCPETSGRNYYSAMRNIAEERRFHIHRGGSLKSCIVGPNLINKRL